MNELFAKTATADSSTGLIVAAVFVGIIVLCLIFAVLSMQGSLKTIQQYLYVLMHYNVPEDEIKRLTQAYQLDNNAAPDPEEDEDNAED